MEHFSTHQTISKDDYLQYYLYTISTTPAAIKQRKKLRNVLFLCLLVVAIWSCYKEAQNGEIPYVLIGLWIVFFPISYFFFQTMEKRKYNRFFSKYINTNHQENMLKGHELQFDEENLVIKFVTHELTMPYAEIINIYENQNGIYIKNTNESSFIFPKTGNDYDKIKGNMMEIAQKNKINFEQEEWKWK